MLRKLSMVLLFLAVCSWAGTALAAYTPTPTQPANASTNLTPDNLVFSWQAPSDPVDSYKLQIALDSSFTDILFDYTVDAGTTSRTVSGLPGLRTIYWRVVGVENGNEHPSAAFYFTTVSDGETYTKQMLKDDFSSGLANWTVTGNTSYLTTTSNAAFGGMVRAKNWSYYYGTNATMTRTVSTTPGTYTLKYKWAHQYMSSYPNDRLTVSWSQDGGNTYTTLLDLTGSSFHSANIGATSPPTASSQWKQQSHTLNVTSTSIVIRFYFYSGWGPDAFLDDVAVEAPGRQLTVMSAHGNPSPSGTTDYFVGDTVSASVESVVYASTAADHRYVCTGWTGTGSVPDTGTANSVTFKIYRTSTLTWQWREEYILVVSSDNNLGNISPSGTTWWAAGASVTVTNSLPTVPTGTDGIRWYNYGYEGTGSAPSSGFGQSVTFTINEPSTLTFKWEYQYRLTVTNPPHVGNPSPPEGESWYSSGTRISFSVDPFVNLGTGAAYTCLGWRGTGSISDGEGNSGTATITMVSTLEWRWLAQYYLTVISRFGKTSGAESGWYDEDSVVSISCGQFYNETDDIRYECRGWHGEGSIFDGIGLSTGEFRIVAPTLVEWQWYKQYKVTVGANHGSTTPSGELWVDDGATLGVAAIPPLNTPTTRYSWAGWVGTGLPDSPSGNINDNFVITAVSSFTAIWNVEFYVTVIADQGTLGGDYDGWYPEGATLDIDAFPPPADEGHRYVPGWRGTGDGSVTHPASPDTPSSVTVAVNSPIVEEVYWVAQVAFDIAVPQGLTDTVPPVGRNWYFIGDLVEGYAPFDVNGIRCTGYEGTGSLASSDLPWFSFVITEPSSATFHYSLPTDTPGFEWAAPETVASAIHGKVVALARKHADGSPVIVFHDPATGTLESTYYFSGMWYAQTIDRIGSGETCVSLVVDKDDIPHVVYYDTVSRQLKYAFLDSNVWRTLTVDPTPGAGRFNSLALDRFGTLHVAYYNLDDSSLYYARSGGAAAAGKAEVWAVEKVDDDGNVGMYCSIAVSQLWGEPHIAYYDSTNGDLKYAALFKDSGGWTFERAATDGDVGINTSIALDPGGRPYIAFQENTVQTNDQGLAFAVRRDTGWEITELDTVGVTGFDASMAIDPAGNLHISYHNYSDLFYARFTGVTWEINRLTSGAEVTDGTALTLDDQGRPAVTYWSKGDLLYMDVTDGHFSGGIVNHYPASETPTQPSPGTETESGGGGGGGCFIATAAFGSYSADAVLTLTAARDRFVRASSQGAALVALYYACSPEVAGVLRSPALGSMLRALLLP